MCYSKEVQLGTGVVLWAMSAYYYIHFSVKYHAIKKKWLLPFLKNIILVFVLAGGHQIFEFLSLQTGNQVIYKIGLILSISATYFLLRSLEIILNRNLRSKISLIIIALIAIHAFLTEMTFEPFSFYLKHNSGFIWASAWIFLFIYFHICAFTGRKFLKDDKSKETILIYLLATLDLSFILSIIYTLWGYLRFSVNVCTDSPSIWCTFSVLQMFVLPFFLSTLPKIFNAPKEKTIQTLKITILYLALSLVILLALMATLPFFSCLSLKFVFP